MLWCTVDVDIEVVVGLGLQQPLPHVIMLFGGVSDVNLPAIRPHELSKASAVVARMPEMRVGSCRSTIGIAVSVAVVREGRRRDLVDGGDCRVTFLEIGLTVPWLPVGSWTTKEDLSRHLVRRKVEQRPQAASAAPES